MNNLLHHPRLQKHEEQTYSQYIGVGGGFFFPHKNSFIPRE